jgi:Rod binding domain-containing protein
MDSGIKISLPAIPTLHKSESINSKATKKTAQEFEAYFILSVLKEFEKTITFTKKSYAEQTQMSLFYEKIADVMAKKGIGIKEGIERYLERDVSKVSRINDDNT